MQQYNIDYDVKYEDNRGYRESMRQVFRMTSSQSHLADDLDDESRDELIYDDASISAGLDYLFEATKDVPAFSELFLIGAGRMLSENREIGLAVLLSYDYFELFHLCLRDFFKDSASFSANNPNYVKLWNKIS
jgi:hypothetical protein